MPPKTAPPSARQLSAVTSLKAAALESAKEADAITGMHQHGGKYGSAREAREAKIAAAKAKREAKESKKP